MSQALYYPSCQLWSIFSSTHHPADLFSISNCCPFLSWLTRILFALKVLHPRSHPPRLSPGQTAYLRDYQPVGVWHGSPNTHLQALTSSTELMVTILREPFNLLRGELLVSLGCYHEIPQTGWLKHLLSGVKPSRYDFGEGRAQTFIYSRSGLIKVELSGEVFQLEVPKGSWGHSSFQWPCSP